MKIGILGDLHGTNTRPLRRKDDYFETWKNKLSYGITKLQELGCDLFLQVGDFTDTPYVANTVKKDIIQILRRLNSPVYCTYGQHDITGHSVSTLHNSPLAVLEAAGVVKILKYEDNIPFHTLDGDPENTITIYSSPFGQEVPEVNDPDAYNVLITHRMLGDEPIPHVVVGSPQRFLINNPAFNLVALGDYHYRFHQEYKGRHIINTGCMIRKTIADRDMNQKPAFTMFDTDTSEITEVPLPFLPPEGVFDLNREEDNSGQRDKILALIEKIQGLDKEERAGIIEIMLQVMDHEKSGPEVKAILDEVLEEVKENG